MEKPTKILLGGIACAGIIASGQLFYNRSLENQLKASEAECVAESKKEPKGVSLICDGEYLEDLEIQNPGAVGTQAKLLSAHRELRLAKFHSRLFQVAVLVAVQCALPWLWYFLLRRIRELRDVIAGK